MVDSLWCGVHPPELLGGVGEGAPVGTAGGEGGDTYMYGWGGKEGGTCRYVQLGVSGGWRWGRRETLPCAPLFHFTDWEIQSK